MKGGSPTTIPPSRGQQGGARKGEGETVKKFYVGRVCVSDLPQGRIRIREHKIVPNIDTFMKAMEFLEAEKINKINELSEGDMAYIAINDHLVVIIEILYGDDDDF